MPLLAHSARPAAGWKPAIQEQLYVDHVWAVEDAARKYARDAAQFWTADRAKFEEEVANAGRPHDLGKLDVQNQEVLHSLKAQKLSVPHEDAGVKYLLDRERIQAAALVYSHHAGLPGLVGECAKNGYYLRRDPESEKGWVTPHVNQHLPSYVELQHALLEPVPFREMTEGNRLAAAKNWSGLTWRLALSCLVDADHGDTARNYGNEVELGPPEVRWKERLAALDKYVSGLGDGSPRNVLRQQIYAELRWHPDLGKRFYACDSPVGTGKTTAVAAHLLRAAQECGLGHVFVVLPYVNIINQSVNTYRKVLTLPGEEPRRAVAAHHHQADYQSPAARQLATLWDCPITVTTAVQFFETLASNHPARLRKLHELPGSAIFIDEAHAAVPSWMWPQAWKWLRELTEDWGCHVVLASGSLARFWQLKQIVNPPAALPELVPETVRATAQHAEHYRVHYVREKQPMNAQELADYIFAHPGPRVVVLNTIRSAALLASTCQYQHKTIFHLSTALAPAHRDKIVKQVMAKLAGKDIDWVLMGTSCIAAGMDFERFRWGARELGSAASMLQLGGRVNREGDQEDSVISVISLLVTKGGFRKYRALEMEAKVLEQCFQYGSMGKLGPAELCTLAMKKELAESALGKKVEDLRLAEDQRDFPVVAKLYRVIEEDTVTVVIDPAVASQLEQKQYIPPQVVMNYSVRIRRTDIERYSVAPIVEDEIYKWKLAYDPDLLGYMAGVFDME